MKMKLSDKSVRILDGFTNSKEVWLEIDLRVTQSHHPKCTTIRLNANDIKWLAETLEKEKKNPPPKRSAYATLSGYPTK